MQTTLALIKPHALKHAAQIENMLAEDGFSIVHRRRVQLTREQAAAFYYEHAQKPFFEQLLTLITDGPLEALVLARRDAITRWRRLIGPTRVSHALRHQPDSIRARFGSRVDDADNAVHGSDSVETGRREIAFFFGTSQSTAAASTPTDGEAVTGRAARHYLQRHVNPTLARGLTQLCHAKPADPIVWLADWLLLNNPNTPCAQ